MAYPLFHPRRRGPRPLTLSVEQFRDEFTTETSHIEFKSGSSGQPLADSAVAFSNAEGGVILIGVTDDGTIRGRKLDPGTEDDVHRALQSARDVGRYDMFSVDVGHKSVVVVAVNARREGFAQTASGVTKVRRGTRDEPLFGRELQVFVNERALHRYEDTATDIPISAVVDSQRREMSQIMGWERATRARLTEASLAVDDHLTVAGALYLTARPDKSLGKAYVELQRFADDTTIDYSQREQFQGPVNRLVTSVVGRVMEALGTELVVLGSNRYELPRLPEVVLREAVANAIAHRSYEAGGVAVRIELRPSAVVVRSPGGFPEGVTEQNIRETNAARNLTVISLLRRFGLAEDQGRGVDVMQDTMAAEMLDPPTFSDKGHEVVVRLPMHSPVAPIERAWLRELERRGDLTPKQRLALVHAARGEVLTNSSARGLLAIDRIEATQLLGSLRDAGFLEQRGQRAGASYVLARSLQPPAGLRLSETDLVALVFDLADEGAITNADVREATGLDRAAALRLLDTLVGDGRLVRTGTRRGTRYVRA